MQLQKATKEIPDVMIEKQQLVIAGELIDGQIVQLKEQKQKLKLLLSKNDLKLKPKEEDIISVKDLTEPKKVRIPT